MVERIRSYKDLHVWQEAMDLVQMVYQVAERLPESEKFGLRPQMCRAAVSVPANIAEGHGSDHRKVFQKHLSISKGSLMELETHVLLTLRLQFVTSEQAQVVLDQIQKVGKLLNGLLRAIKAKRKPQAPVP